MLVIAKSARLKFPKNSFRPKYENCGRDPNFNFPNIPVFACEVAKCHQAQLLPEFLMPDMRKHWQESKFTHVPQILASFGNQILGIGGKLILPMFSDF